MSAAGRFSRRELPTGRWSYPSSATIGGRSGSATEAHSVSAASRSSTISWAMTSGGGRLAASSTDSSLSQEISRRTLSRCMSSSWLNDLKNRSVSFRRWRASGLYTLMKSARSSYRSGFSFSVKCVFVRR